MGFEEVAKCLAPVQKEIIRQLARNRLEWYNPVDII